jgi:hypothetical protein
MPYIPTKDDPFYGGEKIPSLSWKALPVGSTFTVEILDAAKTLQSRDYESGELAYWDEAKTQPKLSAVLNTLVTAGPHSVGEERSIWANIPSNMFVALKNAQKDAGEPFRAGGTLYLRFIGEEPHKNPRMNPIKLYQAKYIPPVVTPSMPDPFAEPPQGQKQAQPADQQQPSPARPAGSRLF